MSNPCRFNKLIEIRDGHITLGQNSLIRNRSLVSVVVVSVAIYLLDLSRSHRHGSCTGGYDVLLMGSPRWTIALR